MGLGVGSRAHPPHRGDRAQWGRRGTEQQTELAEIEGLIAAGKVLSTRIVRTVINDAAACHMRLVCTDGHPTRRHPDRRREGVVGPGDRSSLQWPCECVDGSWSGWVEPLADGIRLDTMRLHGAQQHVDSQHRGG